LPAPSRAYNIRRRRITTSADIGPQQASRKDCNIYMRGTTASDPKVLSAFVQGVAAFVKKGLRHPACEVLRQSFARCCKHPPVRCSCHLPVRCCNISLRGVPASCLT
jgi:hypothetical protein